MREYESVCPHYVVKDAKGKPYRPIDCDWKSMRSYGCLNCGWFPPEAERRKARLRKGLPAIPKIGGRR